MNFGIEDESQEFKESLAQLDKGLKSLTAMLNRHGEGTLYLGVDDSGNLCGLTPGKDTLMEIRNKMRDKIAPRVYPDIQLLSDAGKNYIRVTVRGSDIPYSFDGRYYIRNVSADEQADNTVLRKMLASSDADLLKQKESPDQQLTFHAFFALLAARGIHPAMSEEFLGNYGLLNQNGRMNMNAYLMADRNEVRVNVVTFEGTDKSVMSHRTEYGGQCLLSAMDEVLHYFQSSNVTRVNVTGTKRQEESLYDFPSFREAWVNACLHNDWNNALSPAVYVYDDRIEIVSYGGLPYALSLDGFYRGTSIPVNKSLMTIFIAAGEAEQSGHGVPTIVDRYGKEAFRFADGMLTVTLSFSFEPQQVTARKETLRRKDGLSQNEKAVYEILRGDGHLTLKEVAAKSGLSLSGVKNICKSLQEMNLLIRVGSRRDGYWEAK